MKIDTQCPHCRTHNIVVEPDNSLYCINCGEEYADIAEISQLERDMAVNRIR